MVDSGYQTGSGPASASAGAPEEYAGQGLEQLKKDYLSYLGSKSEEIKEQQNSRRYYHGSQWTAKQIKAFNDRKQPVVTFNRIARKINAVVGLLERQRQDPRGFPRTPKHEQGAEVATAVLRYVLDEQEWKAKSPIVGLNAGIDGLSGIELLLERGDKGDVEVGFETVDPGAYFYDPRSLKGDFSDKRFDGIGKWADVEMVVEQFPGKETEIRASVESGSELTSNPDSDQKWLDTANGHQRLRLVDHWYIMKGEWHWCVYSGTVKLAEGLSPYKDEKGKTTSKYIMFSANVDHDGDRYGFVRYMISSQDEINQRRSKALHIANTRRMVVEDGNGLDVEKVRKEAVRPDGVIVYPHGTTKPEFEDGSKAQELAANLEFLQDAKQEIENYGFNPALMGSGVQDMSGRAIALQQQAGIAELGPYLLGFKGWKLRVYRAIWNAIQEHWTAERWIRVTDDEQLAQFFAVNQLGVDPQTGMPTIVNQLGSLDVDIILDEGPDSINMQADAYETLSVMAQKGQQMPPEVLIEMSPLAGSVKKKILDMIDKAKNAPPNPIQQKGVMLELQAKDLANQKVASEIDLNRSKAASAAPVDPTAGADLEWKKALLASMTSIIVAKIGAKTDQESAAFEAQLGMLMHFSGLQADAAQQLREQAHQQAMLAIQPPPQQPSQVAA
jgi:hypothetical protein